VIWRLKIDFADTFEARPFCFVFRIGAGLGGFLASTRIQRVCGFE
jgi:hypothetical protein